MDNRKIIIFSNTISNFDILDSLFGKWIINTTLYIISSLASENRVFQDVVIVTFSD